MYYHLQWGHEQNCGLLLQLGSHFVSFHYFCYFSHQLLASEARDLADRGISKENSRVVENA